MFRNILILFFLKLFFANQLCLIAQEDDGINEKQTFTSSDSLKNNGLQIGVFAGAYFANKYGAMLYDGYGFDVNGQRNTFSNSVLYNQIVNIYGGGYGNVDQIAELLNVNHQDWYFNEAGMPFNLRYMPTYVLGFNSRYLLNKKESVVFNVNSTNLTVNGKFAINTIPSSSSGPQGPNQTTQHQFTIIGGEQRLMFQLGYQRVLGDNDHINFFFETGLNLLMSKAKKNQAYLNYNSKTIVIDLMNVYNHPDFIYYKAKYFTGVGLGVFGSLGINFNINPKYKFQLLYSPSYDKVKLGPAPAFKYQNNVGLRFYYNLK